MRNRTCWLDDAGRPIQAHGGMIARFGEKWSSVRYTQAGVKVNDYARTWWMR